MQSLKDVVTLPLGDSTLAVDPCRPKLPLLFPKSNVSRVPNHLLQTSQIGSDVLRYRRILARRGNVVDMTGSLAAIYVYNDLDLARELLIEAYQRQDIDVFLTMGQDKTNRFCDYVLTDHLLSRVPLEKQLVKTSSVMRKMPIQAAPYLVWSGGMRELVRAGSELQPVEAIQYDRIFLGSASIATGVPFFYWNVHTKHFAEAARPCPGLTLSELVGFWFRGKPDEASDEVMRFFELCGKVAAWIIASPELGGFRLNLVNIRGENYDKYFASPSSHEDWPREVT